jgi:hypothetical protein
MKNKDSARSVSVRLRADTQVSLSLVRILLQRLRDQGVGVRPAWVGYSPALDTVVKYLTWHYAGRPEPDAQHYPEQSVVASLSGKGVRRD